ncbi:hypothetical protein DFH07DRAFT_408930 [Mycena maculata]|uniref:DUF6534 domain-containing protein n=1 Tax=Mycena maculata TaxID=230809 RepID=A0AAD7JF37_9AGAR|nr:hypothetical protein DFH07DRAFT_408930 [Mycena maculata]
MSSTTEALNSVTPVVPNYSHTVSPYLVGTLLDFFFFGTLLAQVYVYRVCFPKDRLGIKFLVYFILLAMTLFICLHAADTEYWFGTGFGQIERFADVRNMDIYAPIMGSFIAMLVQIFFCYRIVVIRRAAWPLAFLIALISMVQCAGGMGWGVLEYMDVNATDENLDDLHDRERSIFIHLELIGDTVANVLIAITMTYLLLKADVGPAMRGLVENVVRLVVETNIFSATIALLSFLLFVGIPDTSYFVCPAVILPGIYANTLLASLNSRATTPVEEDSAADASPAHHRHTSFVSGRDRAGSRPPVYSASSPGRVLNVPAMSFARRGDGEETPRPRTSMENKWRDEPDSESEYDDEEDRV